MAVFGSGGRRNSGVVRRGPQLCVFEITKPWRRWMTFAKPVNRECFFPGRPSLSVRRLCTRPPMLADLTFATSAVPGTSEIRRDRPLPDESSRTTGSLEFVSHSRKGVKGQFEPR